MSVARDAQHAVDTGGRRAHRATKSTGRLLTATVGFSVAYFLDRESGPARRAHVLDLVRRPLHLRDEPASVPADLDLPRIGLAQADCRPTFQRAVEDIRAIARA
jgi:hypothetical protein